MDSNLRRASRRAFHSIGLDVQRFVPEQSEWAALAKMLRTNGVSAVLDVGASTGHFASHLLDAGYKGRVISFEPLKNSHDELRKAAAGNPKWVVAPRMAIGSELGTTAINISGNVGSSSILPIEDRHILAFPESRYVAQEESEVLPLDEVASTYVSPEDVLFLKIDVQGFEREVLKGAERTVAQSVGIHIELSFISLYSGQPLFEELWRGFAQQGFEPWAFYPACTDPISARMLQVDGIFFREANAL